jgi:hypothetical protein
MSTSTGPGREFAHVRDRQPPAVDEGSALLLALVMVTVIAVVVASALSYATTSLKAAGSVYRPSRDALYAGDAAAATAVRYLTLNPGAGEAMVGGTCRAPMLYGTTSDGSPVTVEMCPNTATSFTVAGGRPRYALLLLPTGTETGLSTTSSGTFYVAGNLYSNTTISAGSATIRTTSGDVSARGACSGNIQVDPGRIVACNLGTQPTDAIDPGYPPAVQNAPPTATGSCDTSTGIATLNAGTWSSASALTAAIGKCGNVWMVPGAHYLENIGTWTITQKVVAGTLLGSITTSPLPGGCQETASGAQLILGGNTNISMGPGGSLQVCGIATSFNGSTLRIPMYGPTRDWAADTAFTLAGSGTPVSTGTATFTNLAQGVVIDGSSTSASVAKQGGTGILSVSGFGTSGVIPAGATVSLAYAATVSTTANAATQITVTNASGSSCTKTASLVTAMPTLVGAPTVTLDCAGFAATAPLSVQLSVTNSSNNNANTVTVDGFELRWMAPGPAIKAQSGCVTTVGSGNCNVLSTSGNGRDVWLAGIAYLPLAKLTLQVPNTSTAVITQSLIARSLNVNATASALTDPIIGSDQGQRSNGDVTINAYVGGNAWVSTRATYAVSGTTITPTLESWVVRR